MSLLGTATRRQETHPPERADGLAEIALPDQDGNERRLGDFWREEPALLIWLRHYG
jgi:hypothetical protein